MNNLIRHKGVTIAKVMVPRYEVRHADGRKVRSFAKLASAKSWIDGYVKGLSIYAPKEPKP